MKAIFDRWEYDGPDREVREATRRDLDEAIYRMRQAGHTNRLRVEELRDRGAAVPMVFLEALEQARYGESFETFMLRKGVRRSRVTVAPVALARLTRQLEDFRDDMDANMGGLRG